MCLLMGGFQAESSCLNLAQNGNPLGERAGRTKFRPSQRERAGSWNFWEQPLDGDILNRVLHSVSVKVATENTDEQLSAVLYLIDKVRSPCEC